MVRDMLKAAGICYVELPGFEADDLIAAVSAVSYTHLDVYKRQKQCSQCFFLFI